MKQLVGLLFVALIIAGAAFIGYTAFTGGALDKEGKAYLDAAVPAIVSSWNDQELLKRASPEFQKAASPADVDRLFRWFRTLGPMQKYGGAQGQSVTWVAPQSGKIINAHYVAKAVFDASEANIEIGLIKHGNVWQIGRFDVTSPALVRDIR
jgi:hypothetical protein